MFTLKNLMTNILLNTKKEDKNDDYFKALDVYSVVTKLPNKQILREDIMLLLGDLLEDDGENK